eukprot:CAMPEP_0114486126 /NCGR_PEP_ID=MMETSP0109-20121206/52_1 /TAXON_ID=29199 /ORGANISM="Chlorarachnion reptans, Strain CCCM449" /LENGTH=85 /DNA_ID=CAMNT_0001662275 /DNA_START=536 /DNA_END=793 /DNA_ORIENTATION=-
MTKQTQRIASGSCDELATRKTLSKWRVDKFTPFSMRIDPRFGRNAFATLNPAVKLASSEIEGVDGIYSIMGFHDGVTFYQRRQGK